MQINHLYAWKSLWLWVNTTTAVQANILGQSNADNSTASTGQNQKQKKDAEEGARERISINIFTKSESANFEFPKTKIGKKKQVV